MLLQLNKIKTIKSPRFKKYIDVIESVCANQTNRKFFFYANTFYIYIIIMLLKFSLATKRIGYLLFVSYFERCTYFVVRNFSVYSYRTSLIMYLSSSNSYIYWPFNDRDKY